MTFKGGGVPTPLPELLGFVYITTCTYWDVDLTTKQIERALFCNPRSWLHFLVWVFMFCVLGSLWPFLAVGPFPSWDARAHGSIAGLSPESFTTVILNPSWQRSHQGFPQDPPRGCEEGRSHTEAYL